MAALLKCFRDLNKFPFETNLFQTLYLILSEFALWCLSLLYLVVGASHRTALIPQCRISREFAGNIAVPKLALECFKIMAALFKCILGYKFETNLFQTLYLIFIEFAPCCLTFLYLVVGVR